jgi:hypothetical protein
MTMAALQPAAPKADPRTAARSRHEVVPLKLAPSTPVSSTPALPMSGADRAPSTASPLLVEAIAGTILALGRGDIIGDTTRRPTNSPGSTSATPRSS